jgi:CubicO group peptidase (beta-lactamase class C family)
MSKLVFLLANACVGCVNLSALGNGSDSLARSTPEAQGVSSSAILAFVESANERQDIHSLMLVRHGHVVAEGWWAPYEAQTRHSMFSLSKSFTSTAVGLAIEEGKLKIDDPVLKLFTNDAPPELSENLRAMRLRDLLRMNTGQHADDMTNFSFNSEEPLVKLFLSMPVAHKPGTHFWYNTPATFMASAMVQKATGQTVLDFLRPRLFDPLGIADPVWEERQGITLGGSGLSIRTEDIARFGQLYLQKGRWNGKQLLSVVWVEEATARQTSNGSNPESDWELGYGYQFWRTRHGFYRGDGAFGQFCIVMPQYDAILAMTSGTTNMGAVMNLVWDKLLPAFHPRKLKAAHAAREKLQSTLAGLMLNPQTGSTAQPSATEMSCRTFLFPTNSQGLEAVTLQSGKNGGATLGLRFNGTEQRIVCGNGVWRTGRTAYVAGAERRVMPESERLVAASGGWTANDTYTAKLCYYETPLCATIRLKFSPDQVLLETEHSVAFGPAKQPQLVGTAK